MNLYRVTHPSGRGGKVFVAACDQNTAAKIGTSQLVQEMEEPDPSMATVEFMDEIFIEYGTSKD